MSELIGFQIALVVIGVVCSWLSGLSLAKGNYHPLNVATVVHSAFAIAPIVMEWIWGVPTYKVFVHMRTVSDSRTTSLVYYAFAASVCIALLIAARFASTDWRQIKPRYVTLSELKTTAAVNRRVMWLGLILPTLLALYSGDTQIWSTYGAILDPQTYGASEVFANALYWSTYIGVISACGLIIEGPKRLEIHAVIFAFVTAALWLNGKRNIVVLSAVLIIIAVRIAGLASKRAIYVLVTAFVAAFIAYSQWYQARFRPVLSAFDTSYEMARMDYGRDSDVRMAIFAEIEADARPILESRGQSFLFDLLFFVPRSVWQDKPRPYYHYITAVALKEPLAQRSWGITTTILSEAIANAGLTGLLLGPLIVIAIGVVGYHPSNPFLTLLTALICTLFLSIHLAGFGVLWTTWCILVVRERLAKARSERRRLALLLETSDTVMHVN